LVEIEYINHAVDCYTMFDNLAFLDYLPNRFGGYGRKYWCHNLQFVVCIDSLLGHCHRGGNRIPVFDEVSIHFPAIQSVSNVLLPLKT
jgi:hypothetical protein